MKTLAIVGSTGTIGKAALKVYSSNKSKFKLIFLSAHSNYKKLLKQKIKYKPKNIFLTNKNIHKVKKNINFDHFFFKKKNYKIDYVISGASGFGALDINLKLLQFSKNLLIANKETIICGGDYFLNIAKKKNCNLIPLDSEHFCTYFFLNNFKIDTNFIHKLILTASGGPFFNKKIKFDEKVSNVTNHPNWKMGKLISINSSNFSNKVLELFEAKILFKLPSSKISINVERKSLIHSLIILKNSIYFPILHKPSMVIPVSIALGLNPNFKINLKNLKIKFEEPKYSKFPLVRLGYEILKKNNHSLMILYTVLNERLVNLYIKNKIKYGEIAKILVKIFITSNLINKKFKKINSLTNIKEIIRLGKEMKII